MKLGTKNIKILACNEEVYIDFLNGTIKSFNIPDGLTEIKSYLFYNCTVLSSVTIPNSVTSIGGSAFENCTSLTSITIPNSVTDIGMNAFYGCTNLKEIKVDNTENSISNAPWGATNATVIWTGVGK